jgi:hypothetical protein
MSGSGLFSNQRAKVPHLVTGPGGVAGEVSDLRQDVARVLGPLAAFTVEEWTNVAAADADGVLVSTATTTAAVTHTVDIDLDPPRNLTLTCDDSAATWAGNMTATGLDVNGQAITEDIAFTNNTTTDGAKAFAKVTSLSRGAQVDANGHYSVGFGTIIGLGKQIKSRAGALAVLQEIEVGTVKAGDALAGTYAAPATGAPNGTYDPGTAPNGTNDYAVFYESLRGLPVFRVGSLHAAQDVEGRVEQQRWAGPCA